ncbi:MAG: hypothetical protein N2504_04315 [candidate division WOR-3 bacterium]|nr:hypothetical protein [candidate division WOR-3 bacterium]MCX7947793.1 hypothetical protein [candidate division WOR-3 bacterium]MDW8150750.1 hypothetical protein [candidate division WOR-3 bacterium]
MGQRKQIEFVNYKPRVKDVKPKLNVKLKPHKNKQLYNVVNEKKFLLSDGRRVILGSIREDKVPEAINYLNQ